MLKSILLIILMLISCAGPEKPGNWQMVNEKDLGKGLCKFYFIQSTGHGLPHRMEKIDSCGKYAYLEIVIF